MITQIESSKNAIFQEDLEYIADSKLPYKKMENKTILITGATGLVGVSLIKSLLCVNRKNNLNMTVVAMVRNAEKAELIYGELINRSDFKIIVGEITEKISLNESCNFIIHCASVTASKVMVTQLVETILTAVEGTKNILDLAVEKNVESLIYVSSMEMYGSFEDGKGDVLENDLGYLDLSKVRSNYPESKRLCENMCIAYKSEYGVPVKIARLAQTFGAGILPWENRVFAQFAKSVISGADIVLHTYGRSEGNYCYTRDAVLGLLLILLNGVDGEAYNVTNPKSHLTIADMADLVASRIAENKIRVVFDIDKNGNAGYAADTKLKLNSDKLQALGWKPEIGLEESYRRMISGMIAEGFKI